MSATDATLGERASARGYATTATAPVESPRAEARSPVHLGAVDWLRLIAIIGVVYYHTADVWYHDAPLAWLGFGGLHALTAAACYFACASRSARSDGDVLRKRFNRLIIPWLVFSTPHLLSAVRSGKFQAWMLWMGGAMHLWFLPFLFVVGCTIGIARRHGLIVRGGASAVAWTAVALAAVAVEPWVGARLPEMGGAWQWVNALPSALLGVAIFAFPERSGRAGELLQLAAIAGVATTLAFVHPADPRCWPPIVALGASLFGIARLLPIRATRTSDFVGRSSFGVYLMHMLALLVIMKLSERFLPVGTEPHVLIILAQVALAVVGCVAAVAVLERTPLKRIVG